MLGTDMCRKHLNFFNSSMTTAPQPKNSTGTEIIVFFDVSNGSVHYYFKFNYMI